MFGTRNFIFWLCEALLYQYKIGTKPILFLARSLQLVFRVLPSVRGASSAVLNESNAAPVALRQLNKVESDVQTHIQEVWGKICSIMEEFFTKHVTKYEVGFGKS